MEQAKKVIGIFWELWKKSKAATFLFIAKTLEWKGKWKGNLPSRHDKIMFTIMSAFYVVCLAVRCGDKASKRDSEATLPSSGSKDSPKVTGHQANSFLRDITRNVRDHHQESFIMFEIVLGFLSWKTNSTFILQTFNKSWKVRWGSWNFNSERNKTCMYRNLVRNQLFQPGKCDSWTCSSASDCGIFLQTSNLKLEEIWSSSCSSRRIKLISSDFSLRCHWNMIYQAVSFVISGRHFKTSYKDLN